MKSISDKKIYVWSNDNGDNFNTGDLAEMFGEYVSGHHSGGYVVVAESLPEAIQVVIQDNKFQPDGYKKDGIKTVEEISRYLTRGAEVKDIDDGIIYYGDGNC